MSAEERAAARGMMQKGALGRTAEEQRAEFDEQFANLPLGDDVTLAERTLGGVPALDVRGAACRRSTCGWRAPTATGSSSICTAADTPSVRPGRARTWPRRCRG